MIIRDPTVKLKTTFRIQDKLHGMSTYTQVEQHEQHESLYPQLHSIPVDTTLQLVYRLQLSVNCTTAFLCINLQEFTRKEDKTQTMKQK